MATHQHHCTQPGAGGEPAPRRFVDPDDLMCPGCGEQPIRCEPPGYWRVTDGLPAPQFSHHDATALCRARGTGRCAEPVEAAGWVR